MSNTNPIAEGKLTAEGIEMIDDDDWMFRSYDDFEDMSREFYYAPVMDSESFDEYLSRNVTYGTDADVYSPKPKSKSKKYTGTNRSYSYHYSWKKGDPWQKLVADSLMFGAGVVTGGYLMKGGFLGAVANGRRFYSLGNFFYDLL